MFFCVILLAVVSVCSGNQQDAADAIQQSLFGLEISTTPSPYSFENLSHMSLKQAPKQSSYQLPKTENLPVLESCQALKCHLNLVLIMDSSGSVGLDGYNNVTKFVKTLHDIMVVQADKKAQTKRRVKVCSGVVSYSTQVHVEVDPCYDNTLCRIADWITNSSIYRGGGTNTNGALKVARQMLQATASYKKVAILITDGKSNTGGSPVPIAKKMREEDGTTIIALGVTSNVDETELKGISGTQFALKIEEFHDIKRLANKLLKINNMTETSHVEMCLADHSVYQQKRPAQYLARPKYFVLEEEENACAWGAWSNCVRRIGYRCVQTRTCNYLLGVRESVHIKRECACPESAHFMKDLQGSESTSVPTSQSARTSI